MEFEDLRAYIAAVSELGELQTVKNADVKADIGAITEISAWSPEHPMYVFEDIVDYPNYRIAVHSFDSYRRLQLLYGFPDGLRGTALVRWWKERLDNYTPLPPVTVTDGPVMENVETGDEVSLLQFPAPMWHQHDAAPYLATGGASVLRDPDTGLLNAGCYRGMVYDRNTIGHHFAAGHHGQVIRDKYFQRGENCPVVITLGQDPSFTLAGAEGTGFNESELEFGGFLRGAPYEVIIGPVTGLPFPATAEVVLEGEVLHPDREPLRMEAPWGEGMGYYSSGFMQPAVRIHAIYYRNNPIIMGEPTLRFRDRGAAGRFSNVARTWHSLETSGLEGIRGIGRFGPYLVVSIKQYYSGHALRVADYAMSGLGDRPPRFLVLVDDDIDPNNRTLVEWAIATRVDPSEQMHIGRGRWSNAVNPAGMTMAKRSIEDYSVGTVIIDACRPFHLRDEWDKIYLPCDIDEHLRQRAIEKWGDALGSFITNPKPI